MVCETYPKRTLSIPFNVSKLLYPMQVDNIKSLLPKKNRESRCASVCVPILLHSIFNTHAVYEALMMHIRESYGIRLFIAVPPLQKMTGCLQHTVLSTKRHEAVCNLAEAFSSFLLVEAFSLFL